MDQNFNMQLKIYSDKRVCGGLGCVGGGLVATVTRHLSSTHLSKAVRFCLF